MKHINLLGNIILDQVYELSSTLVEGNSHKAAGYFESVGAIGNLLEVLYPLPDIEVGVFSKVSNDLVGYKIVELIALKYGEDLARMLDVVDTGKSSSAVIISDKEKFSRTSIVSWGVCSEIKDLSKARTRSDWCHIAYLDKLQNISVSDLNMLRALSPSAIISADLCLQNHSQEDTAKLSDLFKCLDYLIVSDREAESFSLACYNLARKATIVHSPLFSKCYTKAGQFTVEAPPIVKDLNVLGAGDIFAAFFISSVLSLEEHDAEDKEVLTACILEAHINTTNRLKKLSNVHQ